MEFRNVTVLDLCCIFLLFFLLCCPLSPSGSRILGSGTSCRSLLPSSRCMESMWKISTEPWSWSTPGWSARLSLKPSFMTSRWDSRVARRSSVDAANGAFRGQEVVLMKGCPRRNAGAAPPLSFSFCFCSQSTKWPCCGSCGWNRNVFSQI